MIGPTRPLRIARATAVAGALLGLVGCGAAASGESPDTEREHHRIAITVENGEVVDAPGRVAVAVGDQVELQVSADVIDQVHMHGYDIAQLVEPDMPATVTFVADIPGLFDAELEKTHQTILELEVR